MTPPQPCTAKLSDKRSLGDKFVQYTFEFTEPAAIEFAAGQYVSIKVSERGDRRSYSICHSPEVTHGFELLVDITPQGLGTKYLESLAFGDEISLLAPMGRFVVPMLESEKALIFVATGSGVAPFRSMIVDQLQLKNDTRPMTLYWGLRHENQLFWEDEFQELMENYPNFKFHPVISQASDLWSLCRGRVTDCLGIHEKPVDAGYYLCGNAPMIHDVLAALQQAGVAEARIHHEKFY